MLKKRKIEVDRVPKSTALYLRVDVLKVLENGKTNLELQEEQLREYCRGKGYRVMAVYSDYNEDIEQTFCESDYMLPWGGLDNLIREYHESPGRKWERVLVVDLEKVSPYPMVLSSMLCLMTQHGVHEPIYIESICEGIFGKDFNVGVVVKDKNNSKEIEVLYNEFD